MDKLCPLLKEPCIEHKCKFYVHLLGKDPQVDRTIDTWDCSIAWIPILLKRTPNKEGKQGRL